MSDSNAKPTSTTPVSNVTTIIPKKNKGNPNFANIAKSTGPRKNNQSTVIFKRKQYYLPGDIELGLPCVLITRDEIKELAIIGAEWEEIENLYQVSQNDIKKHYDGIYNQGLAIYKIELRRTIVNNSKKDKGSGDRKMLAQNSIGMSDKITEKSDQPKLSESDVKSKLEALLKKHGGK